MNPSYVSYWPALHYYGLTEQVPRTVFVATTRKKRPVTFQTHHFRYVTLKPAKFFGYRRETVGDLPVVLADKEKALIDSLDQPRYAGGIAEVAHALVLAAPDLDVDLLDYARRMADRSLASRLGHLLERQGIPPVRCYWIRVRRPKAITTPVGGCGSTSPKKRCNWKGWAEFIFKKGIVLQH